MVIPVEEGNGESGPRLVHAVSDSDVELVAALLTDVLVVERLKSEDAVSGREKLTMLTRRGEEEGELGWDPLTAKGLGVRLLARARYRTDPRY